MICERHPERPGTLAIDLPSIGVKRYWCKECCDAYPSRGFGRAYIAPWEKDLATGAAEPRIWNDPIEVALRECGERKPLTYRGGSK